MRDVRNCVIDAALVVAIVVCAAFALPLPSDESASAQSVAQIPTAVTSSMAQAHFARHITDVTKPGYLYVAVMLPAGTKKVIVERGPQFGYSRPKWVVTGSTGFSLIEIEADSLTGPDDQTFQIMLNAGSLSPYYGPKKVSALPDATCAEVHIDCSGVGKRRAVRP